MRCRLQPRQTPAEVPPPPLHCLLCRHQRHMFQMAVLDFRVLDFSVRFQVDKKYTCIVLSHENFDVCLLQKLNYPGEYGVKNYYMYALQNLQLDVHMFYSLCSSEPFNPEIDINLKLCRVLHLLRNLRALQLLLSPQNRGTHFMIFLASVNIGPKALTSFDIKQCQYRI